MGDERPGATLSHRRRWQMPDLAANSRAHVVEWDTFGEFCYGDSSSGRENYSGPRRFL